MQKKRTQQPNHHPNPKNNPHLTPLLIATLCTLMLSPTSSFYYQNFNDRLFAHPTFSILTSVSNSNTISDYRLKFYSHKKIPRDCSIFLDFPRSFYEAGLGLSEKSDVSFGFDRKNRVYVENFGAFRSDVPSRDSAISGMWVFCF